MCLVAAAAAEVVPVCDIDLSRNQSKIYTSNAEFFPYYLRQLIRGYNLAFTLSSAKELKYHFLHSGFELVGAAAPAYLQKKLVAIATLSNPSGNQSVAVVSVHQIQSSKEYYINYDQVREDQIPTFSARVALHDDFTQTCYDIQYLSENKLVVVCVDDIPAPPSAPRNSLGLYLYTVDTRLGTYELHKFQSDMELGAMPENVKVQVLKVFDQQTRQYQQYIAACILFEDFNDDARLNDFEQTFVEMFAYSESGGASVIAKRRSISAALLHRQELRVSDFAAIEDWLFILDNRQGIFKVLYSPSGEQSYVRLELSTIERYWAIDVTEANEQYYIQVLASEHLIELVQKEIGAEQFAVRFSRELDFVVENYAEFQSNEEYIGLQLNRLLFVFDRKQEGQVFKMVAGVGVYDLAYNDQLYVINQTSIQKYQLEMPYLYVNATSTTFSKFDLQIQALSTTLEEQKACAIHLTSYILINPDDTDIYNTSARLKPP